MAMKRDWTWCDGEGGVDQRSTRRQFARTAGLGLASVWWMASQPAWGQVSLRREPTHGNVLVVVFLRGGADGLNVVAPYRDDGYYRNRPSLGLANPTATVDTTKKLADLDGFFGLNPALAPLLDDYHTGRLAVVHAVGSDDKTQSHFEAMQTMEQGLADKSDGGSGGWLARHLRQTAETVRPLRAVAFSPVMPDSLMGAPGALAVETLNDYRLASDLDVEALKSLYERHDDAMSQAGRDTLAVIESLNKVDPRSYKPRPGVTYPDSQLGKAMREVAFLIKQEMGLEVACLDSGGWDSHITQGTTEGWLWELLDDLARAVAALRDDLGDRSKKVTVVVQSEFGRRVKENSGLGTDHGEGGCMLVWGGGVQGGKVYADWPGLASDQITPNGNLRVTTDYRNVLSEVLENRLMNPDPSKVFSTLRRKPVGIVRSS